MSVFSHSRIDTFETCPKKYEFDGASVPGKDEPGRAEIEAILREDGLWERFASLSPVSLARSIDAGELPPATAERLAPHVSRRSGARLYARSRR